MKKYIIIEESSGLRTEVFEADSELMNRLAIALQDSNIVFVIHELDLPTNSDNPR